MFVPRKKGSLEYYIIKAVCNEFKAHSSRTQLYQQLVNLL